MDAAEGFAAVFQPAVQITVVQESVFIGGKQAGQHLEKHGGQQGGHHQRAQRVMPGMRLFVPSAAQIAADLQGAEKTGETRRVAAPNAPAQTENQQRGHQQADAQMPSHPAAAGFRAEPHESEGGGQRPMKKADGQIPNFDFLHTLSSRFHLFPPLFSDGLKSGLRPSEAGRGLIRYSAPVRASARLTLSIQPKPACIRRQLPCCPMCWLRGSIPASGSPSVCRRRLFAR